VIEIPTIYFLFATLVALAIAVPVVWYCQPKVAERHLTINYRLVVGGYIFWQFLPLIFCFFFIELLILRSILLLLGFPYNWYSKDAPLEIFTALPLFFPASQLANITIYGLLSTHLSDEKLNALLTQPPLPPVGHKFSHAIGIVVIGWVISLTIVLMNLPP